MNNKLRILICLLVMVYWLAKYPSPVRWADGYFYVAAAEHHLRGDVMRNYVHNGYFDEVLYTSGAYFVKWDQGYPWALARLMQLGLSWQKAAMWINALSATLIVGALLYATRKYEAWIQLASVLAFITLPHIDHVNVHVLSEMLMMVFVSWSIALTWS